MPNPLESPHAPASFLSVGKAPTLIFACCPPWIFGRASAWGATALLLSACGALHPPLPPSTPAASPAPSIQALPAAAPPAPEPAPRPAPPPPALLNVLAYADKLKALPATELAGEAEQLRQRQGPAAWLQLALLHAHKQPPELARAQDLATQAQNDGSPEGQQLQALARLLAGRFAEQRRSEEQLERQNKQVAELQKKLDQSLERLEALKAIERSLGRRNSGRASEPTVP